MSKPKRFLVNYRYDLFPAIACLFLSIYLCHSSTAFAELNQRELLEVDNVVFRIISGHHLQQFVGIGVGRSIAPVSAGLEAMGLPVYNLPLSNFKYDFHTPFADMFEYKRLPEELEPILAKHFVKFLPPPEKLKNKKVVIYDFANSGASLLAAYDAIRLFYQKNGSKIDLAIVALVVSRDVNRVGGFLRGRFQYRKSSPSLQVIYLDSAPGNIGLEEGMIVQKYDKYSAYGEYHLERDNEFDVQRENLRIEYRELIEQFRAWRREYSLEDSCYRLGLKLLQERSVSVP